MKHRVTVRMKSQDTQYVPTEVRVQYQLTINIEERLGAVGCTPSTHGAVDFEVVDDGSGQPFNITRGCSVYQSSRPIRGASFDNRGACMFVPDEQPSETPDLCHLSPDQTMTSCIMLKLPEVRTCQYARRGLGGARVRAPWGMATQMRMTTWMMTVTVTMVPILREARMGARRVESQL